MKDLTVKVKENCLIAENIYKLAFLLPEDAGRIKGGQFVNISTGNDSLPLRRPLGVCTVDGNEVSVCYQVKGRGTRSLAEVKAGRELKVLMPLGNGFDLENYKNIAVIGGGVGIFPLIATIRDNKDKNFYSYIGFRNKSAVCLLNELGKSKKLTIVTDDGSFGGRGNAVEAFFGDEKNIDYDAIISCGPPVMLRALKEKLVEKGIDKPCFVSLEERMGCGVGACLVCVCKTKGGNKRVCKDGPVFGINEVEL